MPLHPGRILKKHLLDPLGMSIRQLAGALRVPANRLSQIVQGRGSVTPDTSVGLRVLSKHALPKTLITWMPIPRSIATGRVVFSKLRYAWSAVQRPVIFSMCSG